MNTKDFFLMNSKEKWGLFAIYILGLAAILPYTLYYCDNADSWQYISLAEKISKGYFYESINAYWSPLISWLLALPIYLGFHSIVSFKIIQLLIGFFTIDAWFKLSKHVGFGKWWRRLVCLIVVPFVLSYAILNLTPDLLFLTLILYCLNLILNDQWVRELKSQLLLAILGSLLYLTKAFGFPLFFALIILTLTFVFFRRENRLTVRASLVSIAIFICLTSCWIVPLSIKNNHFTISEAAKFNLTKEVAPLPGKIVQLPILSGPLIAPPDSLSLSAWETPGDVVQLTSIRPLASMADFKYYGQVVKRNCLSIWYSDFKNQIGVIFLISFLLYVFFRPKPIGVINWKFIFLVSVILLFYMGYGLILVHSRYVWICSLLMILLTLRLWEGILDHKFFQNKNWKLLVLLILAIAVKRPIKEILFTKDTDIPRLWIGKGITHPFETMRINYMHESYLIDAIQELYKDQGIRGNFASLSSTNASRDVYASSCFIVHELNSKYFGSIDKTLSVTEMESQLRKFGITYVLVWNNENWVASEEVWARPVFFDANLGLTIFGLF